MSDRQPGISKVELLAICVSVAAVTFAVTNTRHNRALDRHLVYSAPGLNEATPLQKYGPTKYSRDFEEWIIRDFFHDRRGGVFLDVGSYHYKDDSNTYYLESALGWSGIAVDANAEFAADYKTHRPRTRFVAMFASDVADAKVQFFVPADNKVIASSSKEFTQRYGGAGGQSRDVPTTTLNAVLDQAGVTRLDFMSMDIELSEPKALAGFDIDRFKPALVCIEAHIDVRQQILDYFARHGYVLIGRYLRADPNNLYFEPRH